MNVNYRRTMRGAFQINRTNHGIILRDENGVRKISAMKASRIRQKCIRNGYSVWSASKRIEHYLKPVEVPQGHNLEPVSEVEVFDFKDEPSLTVRFALRSGVYLLRETVTISVRRGKPCAEVIMGYGLMPVKVTGKLSAKKGNYKLFRSNLDIFPNLDKLMAKKLFCCVY